MCVIHNLSSGSAALILILFLKTVQQKSDNTLVTSPHLADYCKWLDLWILIHSQHNDTQSYSSFNLLSLFVTAIQQRGGLWEHWALHITNLDKLAVYTH